MSFSGTSGGRGLKVNRLIQVHLKNGRYIYSGGYSGPYWLVATVLLARVCVATAFTDSIQYIDCPRISATKVPFCGASSPHQFVVIGTIWVHTPNGILMGSWLLTVITVLTVVVNRHADHVGNSLTISRIDAAAWYWVISYRSRVGPNTGLLFHTGGEVAVVRNMRKAMFAMVIIFSTSLHKRSVIIQTRLWGMPHYSV